MWNQSCGTIWTTYMGYRLGPLDTEHRLLSLDPRLVPCSSGYKLFCFCPSCRRIRSPAPMPTDSCPCTLTPLTLCINQVASSLLFVLPAREALIVQERDHLSTGAWHHSGLVQLEETIALKVQLRSYIPEMEHAQLFYEDAACTF